MKSPTPPRATEAANDASDEDLESGDAAGAVEDELEEIEASLTADEGDVGDEDDVPEDLSEETGIDLTDASDLDADNVPADEEFDRVMQAPD